MKKSKWTMFLTAMASLVFALIVVLSAGAADLGTNQVLFTSKSLAGACKGITSPVVLMSSVDSTKTGFYIKTHGANPVIHRILIEESPDGTNYAYPDSVSTLIGVVNTQDTWIKQVNLPPMKYMRLKITCTDSTGALINIQVFKR